MCFDKWKVIGVCKCLNLRLCAYFWAVWTILNAIFYGYLIYTVVYTESFWNYIHWINGALSIIYAVTAFVLCYATYKDKPRLMLPWLYVNFVSMVISCVYTIVLIVLAPIRNLPIDATYISYFFVLALTLALSIYSMLVVNSLRINLETDDEDW